MGDGGNGAGPLADIQRGRFVVAIMKVACERSAGSVTIAEIVASAGMSRRTFYELFEDREDCFLAAVDHVVGRIGACLLESYQGEGAWPERTRAAVLAGLSLLEAEPTLARFAIVETLGTGQRVLLRRQQALEQLADAVDKAREASRTAEQAPPLTAESVVGAVLSLLHARMLEDNPHELVQLTNPLVSMIVLPYLGTAAAKRELRRPSPRQPSLLPSREADFPLAALGMRITYRTVRTLTAIASHPGASNKQVAAASDIVDPGQVSRLLGRLERLGLIQNDSVKAAARGTPNAWRLTELGIEAHKALAAGDPKASSSRPYR